MYNCSKPGCTKKTNEKCSNCKIAYYCSTQCQKAHWVSHRAKCQADPITLDEIIKYTDKTIMCGEDLPYISDVEFLGSRVEGGKHYVFVRDSNTGFSGNFKNRFMDGKNIGEDEFAKYWTAGNCELFNFSVATVLGQVLEKRRILFQNKNIVKIWICLLKVTKKFNPLVIVFADVKGTSKIDNEKTEVFNFTTHYSLAVELEDASIHLLDFAAAQFDMYSKFGNYYVHTEKLNMPNRAGSIESRHFHDVKCSYGVVTNGHQSDLFMTLFKMRRPTDITLFRSKIMTGAMERNLSSILY